MIEQQELLKRVERLEEQVRALQSKVDELEKVKGMKVASPAESFQPKLGPTTDQHTITKSVVEAIEANQQVPSTPEPVAKKPEKSLEQTMTTMLPKVFIIIFVLGVLWGLKVASDYGYFHDGMKVALGYLGSIALFSIAFWMEKKQKGSMQVALMLYGGAFIVGILTTAAGAILYDVLGLYVALLLALLYIGYGVAISYRKGAESLTALVAFTSFLLPYLLEYMAFHSLIIVSYIVLLFGVLQVVILKYQQKYALYVGTFFSVLALAITSWFATNESIVYPLAIVLVTAMFMIVNVKIFASLEKKQAIIHAGIAFSFFMYLLMMVHIAIPNDIAAYISLALFTLVYASSAVVSKKTKQQLLFDVSLSATLISFITLIFYFNTSDTVNILSLFATFAIGLLLANRLRAPFMQALYSLLFTIVAIIIVVSGDIRPFWSVGHLTYILVIVVLVLLYLQLRKPIEETSRFEQWRQKLLIIEWIPISLYVVVVLYSMHFQDAFLQYYSMTYIALLIVILAFAWTLFMLPVQKHVPFFVVTAISFAIAYIVLVLNPIVPVREILVGLFIRLLYMIVMISALTNFVQRGIVYEKLIKSPVDMTWNGVIIAILVGVFGITNFVVLNDLTPWNFKVIVNTVAIFGAAAVSLFIGSKLDGSKIRLFGLSLLGIGIIKMVFFDLSTLDLLVRSVLFIVIGGAGLVLTNKLLTKNK